MLAPEQAAKDYRTDADLHAACEPDAKQLCADVNPGEGRVQDCLRDKAVSVSWECQEELFRQVPLRPPRSMHFGMDALIRSWQHGACLCHEDLTISEREPGRQQHLLYLD